jgi:hypothetical protein
MKRVLVFILLVSAGRLMAKEVPSPVLPDVAADEIVEVAPETPPDGFINNITNGKIWDAWHDRWSSNVITSARYIDRFFADPKLDDESNDTRIKLSLGMRIKEGEDPKAVTRANLRLQLPGTSRKLKLVFEDLVESDDPSGPRDIISDVSDSRPDASLRYNLRKKKNYKIDVDAGVRIGSADQVFTRVRLDRRFNVSDTLKLRTTESVRWWSADGWVSLTQFEIDKQIRWDWLFRSKSELEWAEEETGVKPMQTFSVTHAVSRHRAYRVDVGGIWPEAPDVTEANYFVNFTSRRRIHRDWLYLEIKPGVEFPQEDNYNARFYFTVQFDIILGRVD